MRFAVVGAGFAGLAAAIELVEDGHQVELYEKADKVGGLATGFRKSTWKWPVELFYHHIFTNDLEIISLANKVGCPPLFSVPETSSFVDGEIYRLDSPLSVLTFSPLGFWSRIRMGLGLAILKIIPEGTFLERYKVVDMLPKLVGSNAYSLVWERLLKAKFGKFVGEVNMAWFWSRIVKRTKALGYFEGGFQGLAIKMLAYLKERNCKIFLKTEFDFSEKNLKSFDKVLLTVPAPVAKEISATSLMPKINYLSAQTIILELKKSFMSNYWLNILEKDWPFLVVVEHTNFTDKIKYGSKHIIYLGNYLEPDHKQLKLTKEEILAMYEPYLKKINKNFRTDWINESWLFRANFAQPVFPVNYSEQIKDINKKGQKIWYANMSMVYPFDRGTNYAVALGTKIAKTIKH